MQSIETALASSEVRWQPCFRVISSRYPTIHLFERVEGDYFTILGLPLLPLLDFLRHGKFIDG